MQQPAPGRRWDAKGAMMTRRSPPTTCPPARDRDEADDYSYN